MASWKKYFSAVPTQTRLNARFEQQIRQDSGTGGSSAKYSSFLPEVYSGAPNRVERYISYEQMDLDSEISKALDTISDFSTQTYESGDGPFKIEYKGNLTETEINLLKDSLQQWCSLNRWQQRLWRMFRNTIKYGDQIFIRDPETFKLIWIDPTKVEKIIVNESQGKEIEQYVVRDLDFNLQTLVGTNMLVHDQYSFPGGYPRSSNPAAGAGTINYGQPSSPGSRSSRFDNPENSAAIDAQHVVHLSLSEGLDNQWPFGTSILESIYKVYKQKDLLEDSIIIYRIVRAPERRIFYIDVGSLQGPRAMQYVERIKNEIYQRRIPNRTGGGSSIIDAAYNPISINEDFFLATNSENKGTRIETLPGGENLGCFSLDTKIMLLDGRNLSIQEIANEMSAGKTLWTYSCHPVTGAIAPGLITWAGKTKSNATVLKITLNNSDTVVCTPDHKFPILNKGLVEAKDLQIGQSLMAMTTNNNQIYDYANNTWHTQDSIPFIETAYSETQYHQIAGVEYLSNTIDVGTLTIDGDETYHNWHTYTLANGIATQNSIDDLKYFNNKMIRGLGIPSSYLPTGADDGTAAYNDGKVGTAYVQEYRFSKYCQRLQNLMIPTIDHEFKMFLKKRGIEISSNLFELQFWPPQSFSQYRQMQMDSEQIQVFANLMGTEANKYVSKRFALQRYLGWTEEDILKNEELWKEENAKRVKEKIGKAPGDTDRVGLGSIGIRPPEPGLGDLGMPGEETPELGPESPEAELAGGAVAAPPPPVGGATPAAAGAPAEI